MMVGSLRHPHPRILPVNRNRGWRLVNLGIYVYFDVEWGRRHPHLFSKEGGGRLTKFQGNFQVPLESGPFGESCACQSSLNLALFIELL